MRGLVLTFLPVTDPRFMEAPVFEAARVLVGPLAVLLFVGAAPFLTATAFLTCSGLSITPCFGLHLKYRFPFTSPSCLPSAVDCTFTYKGATFSVWVASRKLSQNHKQVANARESRLRGWTRECAEGDVDDVPIPRRPRSPAQSRLHQPISPFHACLKTSCISCRHRLRSTTWLLPCVRHRNEAANTPTARDEPLGLVSVFDQ